MANQLQITGDTKVKSLNGVLTGTSGVVGSVPLGAANGVATLDSGGKVPVSQLPSSVVTYLGTWNAATNTPTLTNGVGDAGDMYICNVAGTVNFGAGPVTFAVGDWVLYGSGTWQKSNGQNGTVTSVGATITGGAIGITGSPITTAGTLAFAFAGTSGQYVNGAGNLTTFPTLITSIGLSMPSAFSVANSPLTANGSINVTGAGSSTQYIDGTGSLQTFPTIITEAQNLICDVYNETGATLTKGTVVYINGGHGNLPTVTKALATSDATSAQTFGIVQTNITNNNNGHVVVIGNLTDLDTQAYAEGTQLYLSSTTAGAYTSVKQYAPAHLVYVAIVVRSHPTQGIIQVKIQNGFEMDELHNVYAQTPANGGILQYVTSTGLWTAVAGTTTNIAEGTNLYYTDTRARAALSFTAGSGAYNSTTGVITIPTNNNQITNGANYITLTSLSGSTGISYNNTTGAISSTITQYTDALARAAISLTTTGTSGAATYNSTTGVLNIPQYTDAYTGTVTSVGLSAPTGFSVTGSPVTSSGTLALAFASGYSLPTTIKQTNWDDAYTWVAAFPTQTGNNGKYLTTNGSVLSWADNPLGTVTSVAMTVPTGLSVSGSPITSSGTLAVTLTAGYSIPTTASQTNWDTAYTNRITSATAPLSITSNVISISQATTSTNGYLSSTDWNTFNGKGSGTVTSVAALTLGTSGTDLSSSVATSTTTPVITLNVPTASASNRGALSSADWSTFNGKESVLTFSSPLVRTTNTISIPVATTSVNGYLSSTDWTTFNNKQGAITLTTTGTSGAATLVGNTLNIPQYSGGGTITLSAIGSTPNANAATLTGSALNLEPASASFGGVVTTGTQTFAGAKTFSGIVTGASFIPTSSTVPTNGMYLSAANTLNFATNTTNRLTIDSSGNLGIGFTPSAWGGGFAVTQYKGGSVGSQSANYLYSNQNSYYDGTNYKYVTTNFATIFSQDSGSFVWYNAASGTAGANVTFAAAMTLNTSSNLGLGTATISTGYSGGSGSMTFKNAKSIAFNNASDTWSTSTTGGAITYFTDNALYIDAKDSTSLIYFRVNNATNRMIIDGSGNVTIGPTSFSASKFQVTGSVAIGYTTSTAAPTNGLLVAGNIGMGVSSVSAWSVTGKVLEIGHSGGSASFFQNTVDDYWNVSNAYYDGTSWKYVKTGTATGLYMGNGFTWYYAASGTANANFSWTNAMNLNGSGNLGIGTTTIGSKLQVNGNAAIGYSASTAAPTNGLAVSGTVTIGATSSSSKLEVYGTAQASPSTTDGILKLNTSTTNAIVFGTLSGSPFTTYIQSGGSTTYPLSLNPNGSNVLIGNTTDLGGKFQVLASANQSAIGVTGYSLTGANAQSLLDLAGTWNTTGNPTAIKLNITNTASGSTSNLMDLQVGGVSKFKVDKAGFLTSYNTFNTQTASYTLVLTDASKIVEMNPSATATVTVPLNSSVAFPIGTEIAIFNYSNYTINIAATSGVTIRSLGGYLSIYSQYTGATLIKRGTDEWYLIGSI